MKLKFYDYTSGFEASTIPLSIIKNNYLIAHYNSADLSMFVDFEKLKKSS